MTERLRIVVMGYLVRGPLGGLAWHHLQYVLGLADLGHDVWFIEDSDDYPACYDPSVRQTGTDPSYGLQFADRAMRRVDLRDRWAYHDAHQQRWLGPAGRSGESMARTADIVLNLSGVNPLRDWWSEAPVRVFIDTDPVFTQIRHLTDGSRAELAAAHTHHLTFATAFGRPGSTVPRDGFPWAPTRQPVHLPSWTVRPLPQDAPFTTVMQWESYPPTSHDGVTYGQKSESFETILHLPEHVRSVEFELALGSAGVAAPLTQLTEIGWRLVDPLAVTRDPWTYQSYLSGSRGEISVAKHGYVVSGSGWFSERSAAYLASGRPVVVQDTGFTGWLDADQGVLAFRNGEEAREQVAAVLADHRRHAAAARTIAEDVFSSSVVLEELLDQVGVAQP
jgi:hypothetical protein